MSQADNQSERFNQARMNKCVGIAKAIMDNWQKNNSFEYVVRATDSIDGVELDELKKRYFAVGVGNSVQEIPFLDMLVVFQMIRQHVNALKNDRKPTKDGFKIQYQISTEFTPEETASLLSEITITTPFDKGNSVRLIPSEEP